MTFLTALTQLIDGQPMTRACWNDGGQIHVTGQVFHYTNNSGDKEPYEVTTEDMFAGDWEPVGLEMTETTIPMMAAFPKDFVDPFA